MAPIAVEQPVPPTTNGKAHPKPVEHGCQSFDATKANLAELSAVMKRDGCLYLRNLISQEDIDQINEDMRPHLDDDTPWDGVCFPPETKRLPTLQAKSDRFRQKVIMSPLWLELCHDLLSVTTANWFGDMKAESTAEPCLGGTMCFRICPGATAQGLHRDSMGHHLHNPKCTVEEYTTERDTCLSMFLAGTPANKENGSTRFCPGSHLEKTDEQPSEDRAIHAELAPGDALIMFHSLYHAGSANMTKDQERLVYHTAMIKGFMRQLENQYIAVPHEQAATWTDEELAVCGYKCSQPFLGSVNFIDPMDAIRGSKIGHRYDMKDFKVVNGAKEGTTAAP